MHFPRKLLKVLKNQISTREIIVLTGMRRVGKTTLYRMLFDSLPTQNKVFLDLENPIDQKIFEEADYNNIWANLRAYDLSSEEKAFIFIDEIQAMPEVVKAVKYLYDHYPVKFFLTGSSSYYLKNLFPESLAGRKFLFEMFPLDFEEFLIFKKKEKVFYKNFADKEKNKNLIRYEKLKALYEEYVNFGGFPEVVLQNDLSQKQLKLDDIFKSYFEKDVKNLSDFKQLSDLRDLILLLMQRTGSKLEITKLASEIEISRTTVYSYLAFLEGTYFISLISPYSKNVDREVSSRKKVYFCDSGILNHFAQLAPGNLFENTIYNNLRKYGKINYYQRRTGAEIDFILNQKIAVEVKTKGLTREMEKLEELSKSLNLKEHYIVTREFNDGKKFIPAVEI